MDEQGDPKKSQTQVERALLKRRPAWRAGYDYLMSTKAGVRYYDALLAVWLSCSKQDRGDLSSHEKFADFIGVSRAVTYQWLDRRPEIKEWARELVELRFDASVIGEVDRRVIQKAMSMDDSTPAWATLFYKRAGVLKEEFDLHLQGAGDGPAEIMVKAVDYRNAIAPLTSGSEPDRLASGENQMPGDGPEMG